MFGKRMFVFDADKGNGGGDGQQPANTVTPPETTEVKTFTQEQVDTLIKERLDRERKKTQATLDEARKQNETDAAQKNGEWQKLAEQRETELGQLRGQLREATIRATAARMGFADLDYAVFLVTRAGEDADAEQVLKERATQTGKTPASETPQQSTTLPRNATNPAVPLRFTPDQIAKMTPAEINQNWEAVSAVLAAQKK